MMVERSSWGRVSRGDRFGGSIGVPIVVFIAVIYEILNCFGLLDRYIERGQVVISRTQVGDIVAKDYIIVTTRKQNVL